MADFDFLQTFSVPRTGCLFVDEVLICDETSDGKGESVRTYGLGLKLFVFVVGWSEVSLYSWFASGSTVIAVLACERGFGCNGF